MSIKVITEPKVYLIARQESVEADVCAFLKSIGADDWQGDAATIADAQAEFAGRVCYQSFKKPRPGGNTAYISHILESGHGCYDGETEVLTNVGWLPFSKVEGFADHVRFATRAEDGRIEYQAATAKIAAPYSGRMYRVDSEGVDLLVTPNHRMLVCPTTTREGRKKEDYQIIHADELGHRSHAYIKDGDWNPECPYLSHWTPQALAMLGFTIGDGHYPGYGRLVRFHLRRPRKIAWLASMATTLGWGFWGEGDRFEVEVASEFVYLFRDIYDRNGEKQIPQDVLMQARPEQLRGLYEGLIESDGHTGRTGVSFDTTSQRLAGQFQQLCLHIGVASNVSYTIDSGRRATGGSFGTKPLTRLSVITRKLRPEVNKHAGADGRTSWVEDWRGMVYCVEVPNGTLYVRRNGKPVWCGNSVLEHAVWTILITGVSRSLTHELIRHRHLSPSQLSQRFVDESECAFVCPPAYVEGRSYAENISGVFNTTDPAEAERREEVRTAYVYWRDAVEWAQKEYVKLLNHAERSVHRGISSVNTPRLKAIREAARSVLPNCTATKIVLTGNARAWRNVLEQRGTEHADAEIRRLALALLRVFRSEAPNIFSDMREENGVIVCDHHKV